MKATIIFVLVVIALVGLAAVCGAYYVSHTNGDATPSFRTAMVKRGDLLSTISATGTVEPEEVVDVGAQIVGTMKNLGFDPGDPQKKKTIDYGSVVQEGTILAVIDDSVYKAQVDQAQAALLRAKADLIQMQAKAEQTKQEWKRADSLRPTKAIADTDFDLAVANYKVAQANVAVGEAAIKQSEAALRLANTNLDYTIIKSPVRGVIIARRVNVGQTVVATFNAPSLFLIAKDLRRMQVWASVNEADIGRIRPGQPAQFGVDAYPGETFRGKVLQIRLNATMTQNVVTYTVVVETDNSDLKLLPYLTANLRFEVDHRKSVLLVPNAALRWKPRTQQMAPDVRETAASASSRKGGGGGPKSSAESPGKSKAADTPTTAVDAKSATTAKAGPEAKSAKSAKEREDRSRLWVQDDGFVRPVEVQVGATDGSQTEISGSEVQEGTEVVIGEVRKDDLADAGDTTNPFAPKLFRGGQKKPQ
jgi:HlyD family secretion protein